jgi:autotransporter-associated beta strand protein
LKIAFHAAVNWSGFMGTLNYYAVNGQVFNVFLPASCNLSQAVLNTGGGGTPPGSWSSLRATGVTQLGALSGSTCYLDIAGTLLIGSLNTNTTFSGYIIDTGGITKVGTGTLALTGANTYTGPTAVNNGTLLITTMSPTKGNYTVANGATLGVTNVASGSALVSNLTVVAGSTLEFRNLTSATTPLIVASNVAVNGSCTVKITGTKGLVAGGSYPLVSYAGALSSNFANFQLQMPYGWRGMLVNSGNRISLANIAVVSTASPQMSATPNGQQLQLFWPQANTGWRLQVQTNAFNAGLGTNWVDVPSAVSTNQITLPIGTTNGSVFYRLVYP